MRVFGTLRLFRRILGVAAVLCPAECRLAWKTDSADHRPAAPSGNGLRGVARALERAVEASAGMMPKREGMGSPSPPRKRPRERPAECDGLPLAHTHESPACIVDGTGVHYLPPHPGAASMAATRSVHPVDVDASFLAEVRLACVQGSRLLRCFRARRARKTVLEITR